MMIRTILKSKWQSLRLFTLTCVGSCLFTTPATAQLSQNPDKFLGNITTAYRVDAGGGVEEYYKLWNQITPENESKWGSVEGTKGSYNWGSDTPFNYAKQYGFTYKFHALVWGAQYPNWFSGLSLKDRYNAIESWFNAVK
ncbi:MAG: endo-1,4-beta-xylanase, partial [Bacteroidaceae bacterium]|nr:endo-1,4-beta-xylanase [Bacteroidaceae bacterium]